MPRDGERELTMKIATLPPDDANTWSIDFESTYSKTNSLKIKPTWAYVYDPETEIYLLSVAGPDNFVCRLYPMTVREIGPGVVVGEERLIASATRTVPWPPRAGTVRVYRYDREGALLPMAPDRAVAAGEAFTLEVPEAGLVIAELR